MMVNEPKDFYEKRDKEIFVMYNDGCSLREIGEKYKLTKERIRQIVEKFEPRKEKHIEVMKEKRREKEKEFIDIERIRERRLQHKSWAIVCKEIGVSYHILRKVINMDDFSRSKKDGLLYCQTCGNYYPVSDFYYIKNGKNYHSYRHIECVKKYQKERREKRKRINEESSC